MHDSKEIQIGVLQDLIDKMRSMDGEKMRPPKAVELSVSDLKPEPGEGTPEEEKQDLGELAHVGGNDMHGGGADDEELSPEDAAIIEELLGGKEHEA